jgi:adenylate cyclase
MDAEQRRALRKPPESLGAWEAYQRGLWHMGRGNPTDHSRAQQFFRQAIDAAPSFASAYSASAMAIILDSVYGNGRPYTETWASARERAREAAEIDPSDADAQAILALSRFSLDGVEQGSGAISALSATLAHSPNAAWAHGINGMILVQLGQCVEGRESLLTAERLNPRDPSASLFPAHFPTSYYYERDYAHAVDSAKAVVERYPNDGRAYRWLAAALGQLGRVDEAREALHKAIQVSPESFTQHVRSRPAFHLAENYQHMLEGLRKAGWQG